MSGKKVPLSSNLCSGFATSVYTSACLSSHFVPTVSWTHILVDIVLGKEECHEQKSSALYKWKEVVALFTFGLLYN